MVRYFSSAWRNAFSVCLSCVMSRERPTTPATAPDCEMMGTFVTEAQISLPSVAVWRSSLLMSGSPVSRMRCSSLKYSCACSRG